MLLTQTELINRLRYLAERVEYLAEISESDSVDIRISREFVPYVTQALKYTAQVLEEGQ